MLFICDVVKSRGLNLYKPVYNTYTYGSIYIIDFGGLDLYKSSMSRITWLDPSNK